MLSRVHCIHPEPCTYCQTWGNCTIDWYECNEEPGNGGQYLFLAGSPVLMSCKDGVGSGAVLTPGFFALPNQLKTGDITYFPSLMTQISEYWKS